MPSMIGDIRRLAAEHAAIDKGNNNSTACDAVCSFGGFMPSRVVELYLHAYVKEMERRSAAGTSEVDVAP